MRVVSMFASIVLAEQSANDALVHFIEAHHADSKHCDGAILCVDCSLFIAVGCVSAAYA